jgi:hypothetical protein
MLQIILETENSVKQRLLNGLMALKTEGKTLERKKMLQELQAPIPRGTGTEMVAS